MEYLIIAVVISAPISILSLFLAALAFSSRDLARESLKHALDAHIAVQALKGSTHTVIPIGAGGEAAGSMAELEKKLREVTGLNGFSQGGMDDDLAKAGFPDDVEDLV